MLQSLPLEIITLIANFLDIKDTGELAKTCQSCYFASLPHIWYHLTLNSAADLVHVKKRLETNFWSSRAGQFVRDITFCGNKCSKKYSSAVAASMFGIASLYTDRWKEEIKDDQPHQHIDSFGQQLLDLFPHITSLVLDFNEAQKSFCDSTKETPSPGVLPFTGSLSLINYKADNVIYLHNLLAPFTKARQLILRTLPVVSLCDDVDESILTSKDIQMIASLHFGQLARLELVYLDIDVDLNILKKLVTNSPSLRELTLSWIFRPGKEYYEELCQVLDERASLYAGQIQKKSFFYQSHFAFSSKRTK